MSLPTEDMPSSSTSNDGSRRKSGAKSKSFDLEAFHQLRLERLENQRRAEQLRLRGRRNDHVSRLRWNSDIGSSSSMVYSQVHTVARSPLEASRSLSEPNSGHEIKNSARQELMRLGRRYTSRQSRVLSASSTHHTVSLDGSGVDEHHVESQSLSPSPTNGSCLSLASENELSIPLVENEMTHTSPHSVGFLSQSYSTPIEATSHHNGGSSALTPNDNITSNEGIGMHGSHYLLLARSHSTISQITKTENQENNDSNALVDEEDESSSASYSTPAPKLQAASACNSHGENEDECDDVHPTQKEEDAQEKLDHFSSFCRAQVLISEIEHKSSGDHDDAEVSLSKEDGKEDRLGECHKKYLRTVMLFIVQCTAAIIAGVAIYFCWRDSSRWYKLTYSRMSSAMIYWRTPVSSYHWSFASKRSALYSKIVDKADTISLFCDCFSSGVIGWFRSIWSTPVSMYTEWRKDIDVLSLAIEVFYSLEKKYYDSWQLLNETVSGVQDVLESSATVWNMTFLASVTFWQHLKSEQLNNKTTHVLETQDHIMIGKSAVTSPLLLRTRDTLQNETLVSLAGLDSVESHEKSPSAQFWSPVIKGTPFVRHPRNSIRHRHLHSIPSFGAQLEADYNPIATSSALHGLWNLSKRSSTHSFPVIGVRHSHISIETRLEKMAISSDIRKNIAALVMVEKSSVKLSQNGFVPPQKTSHEIMTLKRNYYESSFEFSPEEKPFERDAFDDVDVMRMASEFVGKVWQQKSGHRRLKKRLRLKKIGADQNN